MPLIPNPTAGLIEQVLRFRNHRHDVLASNIANANTPGYRAFDVQLSAQGGGSKPIAMRTANPRHIQSSPGSGPPPGVSHPSGAAPRLDGNNVDVDTEFLKLTENRLMYQTAFELYETFGGLTRLAREVR